jgi:hypothetical protein
MKANQTTTTTSTRTRLVVLFAFLLLSSVGVFGQTVKTTSVIENAVATDDTVAASQNATTTNDTMNFVSWFMGTKQTLNATPAIEVNKKAMINSGITPNRLLIKAFLKKASNYTSTVA